jgi:biopolymer transport protein ExbB/TolQ
MITERLMQIVVAGGSEWVMLLLLGLSIISIAIVVERGLFLRRRRNALDRIDGALSPLIQREDSVKMRDVLAREDEPALQAAVAGHERSPRDRSATEKIVASELSRERLRLERRLAFLGTLGNNAPFIGLFGTVLGIIRAFRDLSLANQANTSAVMAGISEALVATAVGLFVALPAVLFYNFFQRQVDRVLSVTESLAQGILAGLPEHSRGASGPIVIEDATLEKKAARAGEA